MVTIGKYLLDALYARGVKDIFGLPGDYVIRFDKLIEEHPIRFINTTRENTAGYMADAYARLLGLGAACITYGVGINIVNAVSQAFAESSPVVVISGAAGTEEYLKGEKLHHLIHKSVHERLDTTQLEIMKNITIDQTVLDNPYNAKKDIDRVLDRCLEHKKPVYIEIPRNMVDVPLEDCGTGSKKPCIPYQKALEEALAETADVLLRSKSPILWIGHEVHRYGLAPYILEFAEKHRLPIVSSLLGKTAITEYHPLFGGVYLGKLSRPEIFELVENCDCLLMLGVMVSDIETGIFTAKLDQEHKIEACTEGVKIGHHFYSKVPFDAFIKGLAESDFQFQGPQIHFSKPSAHSFHPNPDAKITTKRFFECLQSYLTPENIVVADVGDCLFGSADLFLNQNSFLACAYFATLGFGTPGAIAAQIAVPEKRAIGVIGDGAFQMTSMELSTAVRYHLDPIIILLNNHGYGTERPLLEGSYNDILNWNYTEIPKVLGGGIGIKIKNEEELNQALKTALSERGNFYLIEVELDKTDFSPALRRLGELMGATAQGK